MKTFREAKEYFESQGYECSLERELYLQQPGDRFWANDYLIVNDSLVIERPFIDSILCRVSELQPFAKVEKAIAPLDEAIQYCVNIFQK